MGPEALRVAGLVEALAARGIDVIDRGNVEGPRNPWQPPVEGYRHLDEVVAWNRAVLEATTRELDAGRMPIMLGGDHFLAIGSIMIGIAPVFTPFSNSLLFFRLLLLIHFFFLF